MSQDTQAFSVGELFSIKGKVALVTGGSRGIGLMIARGYVESGARVYISSRKKEVCDAVAAQLSEVGECVSLPADLSTTDGCKRLADELSSREAALHILVNNAGAAWGAALGEYPEEGWDKVMDTNVKGVFFLTQHMLPLLERGARAGDPARVINIGSIDGIKVPLVENYAYGPSKAPAPTRRRASCRPRAPKSKSSGRGRCAKTTASSRFRWSKASSRRASMGWCSRRSTIALWCAPSKKRSAPACLRWSSIRDSSQTTSSALSPPTIAKAGGWRLTGSAN